MEMPTVITQTKDPKNNFTFKVRAYRTLTPQEMRQAFYFWNQQRDRRYSVRNKTVEVTSIIGHDE